MITIALAASMNFGYGTWECTHEYQYPNDNIKEIFVSRVLNNRDLTYIFDEKLIYKRLDSGKVLAQAKNHGSGVLELSKDTFSIHPKTYEVSVEFDHVGIFTPDYIDYLRDSGLKPGYGLTIDKLTETEMTIRHIESGDITKCLSDGV